VKVRSLMAVERWVEEVWNIKGDEWDGEEYWEEM
jgi:hypothetical protein